MGMHYYGMHFGLYIPKGAEGVFSFTVSNDPNETFLKNSFAEDLTVTDVFPANVTVLQCSIASDCDDGDACTTDSCVSNHCLTQNNVPEDRCCNSQTGELTVIDDGDICTVDTCLPDGTVSHVDPVIPICADSLSNRYLQVEPQCCDDESVVAMRVSADLGFMFADIGYIQPDATIGPVAHYDSLLTWEPAFVGGPLIRPSTTYRITIETQDQSPPHGEFLTMTTSKFGDVNKNGFANIDDVFTVARVFAGMMDVPYEAADVAPCVPNGIVNLEDVFWTAFGFQEVPFSMFCPTGACCDGEGACEDFNWFGMYEGECPTTWVEGETCMMLPCP